MKKSIIASVVALGMVSGLAQAAVNEVQFQGNVTTVSCDLVPSVDGSMDPNGVGKIQLGDVAAGGTGKIVSFAFKPAKGTQNEQACDQVAGVAGKTLDLTWSGAKFGAKGLGALDGSAASDSNVEIKPVNSTNTAATFVKASGEKNTFNTSVLKSGTGEGLKYEAVLKAGTTPGEFAAAATFNVTYN
ncbi:fimbrial protein [Escherichia sp. E4742]|uniref:fimbrial protein n=1 Tax=Escherichia sp. E4742 TaxID=2044467 RepID=UPI0010811A3D|nr:fimbrial protein [Escherichia sp. E4742]EFN6235601.1 fimbrial protein [Escherichia coli]QCT87607.1 fimbrial protein [Escherichia sp. E4742]TGB53923.1 fimbrial protein [Escherichia sp. E4742]TLJ06838.1 fimbrial protein [Escherichia sp. E4742]